MIILSSRKNKKETVYINGKSNNELITMYPLSKEEIKKLNKVTKEFQKALNR